MAPVTGRFLFWLGVRADFLLLRDTREISYFRVFLIFGGLFKKHRFPTPNFQIVPRDCHHRIRMSPRIFPAGLSSEKTTLEALLWPNYFFYKICQAMRASLPRHSDFLAKKSGSARHSFLIPSFLICWGGVSKNRAWRRSGPKTQGNLDLWPKTQRNILFFW